MKVSELIEHLKTLPQDKSIICQVIGQDSGVWNLGFEFNDVESSWMVQLKVEHPCLMSLPETKDGECDGWEHV